MTSLHQPDDIATPTWLRAVNVLQVLSPLMLALGVAYLGLVVAGVAPRPIGHPAIDQRPDDANWAAVAAIATTTLGGVLAWTTRSRRALVSALGIGAVVVVVGVLLS